MLRQLLLTLTIFSATAHAQKINTPRFSYQELHSGNGMTAFDFDSAGNLFVCEKQGRILVFSPDKKGGFQPPSVFADFNSQVNPDSESGLLGIALDPQFRTNHHLYVFYTADKEQRLVRLTATGNPAKLKPGSERVLLDGLPRIASNHKAGDIRFHPADPDAIYLVLGDDTRRELAPDLKHYHGKLLRVSRSNGKGLPDNPFYDGNPDSVRSRVWARGFRNPFRFSFVPGQAPDSVYVSENGDGTDRIAKVKRGADAGWGIHGDKQLVDPPDPDTTVLHTSRPCLTAICIAPKGPFAPKGPVLYAQNWFSQNILRWKLDGPMLDQATPLAADRGKPFASECKFVHAGFGPDGALYLTQTYYGPSDGNNHKLARIVPE